MSWRNTRFALFVALTLAVVLGQVQGFVVQTPAAAAVAGSKFKSLAVAMTEPETDPQKHRQKRLENANKRINQLDALVEELDAKIAQLDDRMLLIGDEEELVVLQKEKERLEKQVAKHLNEWDDLEELLESFSSSE